MCTRGEKCFENSKLIILNTFFAYTNDFRVHIKTKSFRVYPPVEFNVYENTRKTTKTCSKDITTLPLAMVDGVTSRSVVMEICEAQTKRKINQTIFNFFSEAELCN